ncbi:class I SAM-dependent methyltransferase [Aeromicrobium sp. CF3.5]|uniref:class I SAM-dependent methyltransferase n=1 Tax=Aeromicrobium sp. CF3.5 TaxID=3373078 RepID=UPI003EE7166F
MGPVRSEVMWQAVMDAVQTAAADGEDAAPLAVLDLGGGTGGDAVRLACDGHDVTVVDPSPDALASLERRAAEAVRSQEHPIRVRGVLGDTTDLLQHVEPGSFDLLLCHGVLEHVDDPDQAMGVVASALRPGGHASVVVAGRLAGVVARALAGDFRSATRMYEADLASWNLREMGPRRFTTTELDDLLSTHGLSGVRTRGLRAFTDLVPSALVDIQPGAREALFALERLVADHGDFTAWSGGLQLIARLDLSQY